MGWRTSKNRSVLSYKHDSVHQRRLNDTPEQESKENDSQVGSSKPEMNGWRGLTPRQLDRGKAHQSSTVAAHTNVVSCQLQDADGNCLGSAHIDEEGKVYPNTKWEKSLSEE